MKDPLCKQMGQRVRHDERAVVLINTAYDVQEGQKDAKRTLAHAQSNRMTCQQTQITYRGILAG